LVPGNECCLRERERERERHKRKDGDFCKQEGKNSKRSPEISESTTKGNISKALLSKMQSYRSLFRKESL
jgi:hypothetical protein